MGAQKGDSADDEPPRELMDKAAARRMYRDLRDNLPPEVLEECSRVIINKIISNPIYKKAQVIMLYCAIKGEIDTRELIRAARLAGKRVCLPVARGREMTAVEGDEMITGSMGILEPKDGREVSPEAIELVIVPGIAFDMSGYRLGYGGGYYDGFLARVKCPTIGICPRVCLADELPREAHDIAVDAVVTE